MKKFDRTKGIGGSEVASLVGENPYESSMDIYLKKIGVVEDQEENEAMRWGNLLEEPIAQEYARRNLVTLTNPDMIIDKRKPFFFVSPDRFVLSKGGNEIQKGLEIKTAGIHTASKFGLEGTDEIPSAYLIQIMWGISITKIPEWDLAALIAGQQYKEYHIQRDEELVGNLRDIVEKFWIDNVQAKVPPTPDGTARTREAISKLYPENRGHFHPATSEDIEWANILRDARREISVLEETKGVAENNLKLSIADGDGILLPDNEKITWKKTKGRVKVDYKGLIDKLEPSEELIQRYTSITDGHKMFLVPRKWKEKK